MPSDTKPAGTDDAQSQKDEVTEQGGKQQHIDPEIVEKISKLRSNLRENFGKIAMAMMMVPRYRAQTFGDMQHLILDPMLQDRVAMAYPSQDTRQGVNDMTGFAIWASVSEEVDTSIREQIANGVFPIRLKSGEWNSGNINWLLDVIAPSQDAVTGVIANFRQVAKDGDLRLHPLISRLVDPETLEKMGAKRAPRPTANEEKPGS